MLRHIHNVAHNKNIFAHFCTYFSIFRHIQDPGITGSNNKSGCLFKSLFKSVWNIFLIFVLKIKFFLKILNFLNNNSNSNNIVQPKFVRHSHYPRQHATQTNTLPIPLTLSTVAWQRRPCQQYHRCQHVTHVTYAIQASFPPMLKQHQRHACLHRC